MAWFAEGFGKANGTDLGPALTWTELDGDWSVTDKRAVCSSASQCNARADHDLLTTDNIVEATVHTVTGGTVGVLFRASPTLKTFYFYERNASGGLFFWMVDNGVYTDLSTSVTWSNTSSALPQVLRVVVVGSLITFYRDGLQTGQITHATIDGVTKGGRRAGLRGYAMNLGQSLSGFSMADVDPGGQTARLAPDAILATTGLTGAVGNVQDDPDSADANWLTA